jgi:hypothetical protein
MNIIELAKEAGLLADDEAWVSPHQEAMERFFDLAFAAGAAHEREACAKVCDGIEKGFFEVFGREEEPWTAKQCAAAIRARSEK